MKISEKLDVFYQIVNFSIFLYFSITLINVGQLDILNLLISGIGLLGSLIISIISAIEKSKEKPEQQSLNNPLNFNKNG